MLYRRLLNNAKKIINKTAFIWYILHLNLKAYENLKAPFFSPVKCVIGNERKKEKKTKNH